MRILVRAGLHLCWGHVYPIPATRERKTERAILNEGGHTISSQWGRIGETSGSIYFLPLFQVSSILGATRFVTKVG